MRIFLTLCICLVFPSELGSGVPTEDCESEDAQQEQSALVEEIYDIYSESLNNLKEKESQKVRQERSLGMEMLDMYIPKKKVIYLLPTMDRFLSGIQNRVRVNPFIRNKGSVKYTKVNGDGKTKEMKWKEKKEDEEGKRKKKGKGWKVKKEEGMKHKTKNSLFESSNYERENTVRTEKDVNNKGDRNTNQISAPKPPDGRAAKAIDSKKRNKPVIKDDKVYLYNDWSNKLKEIKTKERGAKKMKRRRKKRTIKEEDECPIDEREAENKTKEWDKYFKGLT